MIENMHNKTNSPLFKVIFALVSLSFVLGGISGTLLGQDTSAVKVNGQEIAQTAFNQAKSRQQNLLNAQMGERFWDLLDSPEYVEQFNQAILNELIDSELLRQYAMDLKLAISRDQIVSEIVNNPDFHQDGKYSEAIYQQFLRNNGISADQYGASLYKQLLFAQLQNGLMGSQFSVPVQQELLAKLLLQKRTVRLASYSLANEMEQQSATDAEIQAYYDAHKAEFVNPEKLSVEYVSVTPQDLESRVQITPEQIETYYQMNRAQFVTAGEAKIAHIQVADQATANEIEQQLKNGADFATLAKQKSTDTLSAAQGGELGWAKAGVFPKAFEAALNSLQVGQISSPVNVDGAFHIIKVLERKAENVVPLEQVKESITKTIRAELVATEYSTITREMANKAFEVSGSLDDVAAIANVKVHKTEAFSRDQIPEALNHEKVIKVLFNGDLRQTGQNSDAIDLGTSTQAKTLFLRVSSYQTEREQTLDEAKLAVTKSVKREKAEKALLAKAEEQLTKLQAGQAQEIQFTPAETLMFVEAQTTQPVLAKTVFAMAKPLDKASYQVARNVAGDVIIVALDKVEDGKLDELRPFMAQLAQADSLVLYNNLLQDLRERATIEYNQDFLDQINNVEQ